MLDGNAIAGVLEDIFGADMTLAACTCAECGRRAPVAETAVYLDAPGAVVRCRQCDAVLAVVIQRRTVHCVDLNGISALASP